MCCYLRTYEAMYVVLRLRVCFTPFLVAFVAVIATAPCRPREICAEFRLQRYAVYLTCMCGCRRLIVGSAGAHSISDRLVGSTIATLVWAKNALGR